MTILDLKTTNIAPFRKLFLDSDTDQFICITEEDIDNLLYQTSTLLVSVTHGDNLKDAISKIEIDKITGLNASKAIVVIRSAKANQVKTAEITEINNFTDAYLPNADISWGLATRKKQEDPITVVLGISF